jgi:hypothetical protein
MRQHSPLRTDDRGEMLVLMFGMTAMLLGLAAVLLVQMAKEPGHTPVAANQDAVLAGAVVLRQEALGAGLAAGDLLSSRDLLNVDAACTAAGQAAAAGGAQVVTCELAPTGFTVVTAWADGTDGQAFESGTVELVDDGSCLAMDTSWGEQLPARCA